MERGNVLLIPMELCVHTLVDHVMTTLLTRAQKLKLMIAMANALQQMHLARVIHRDIKVIYSL